MSRRLLSNGIGYVWGKFPNGTKLSPERVSLGSAAEHASSVSQLALGAQHYAVLCGDGALYVAGKNKHGQLGLGNNNSVDNPVRVEGIPPMAQVACGNAHSAAVTVSGEVFTWGLGRNLVEFYLGRTRTWR